MPQKIRIRLKAFDHKLLDRAVKEIIEAVKGTGARVAGPIPLPTRIERFCVLRSPHVDKRSMEHLEIRTHKRLIEIYEPTSQTTDVMNRLELSPGVEVDVRMAEV